MKQDTPNRVKYKISLNLSTRQAEVLKSWRFLLKQLSEEMYIWAGEYKDSIILRNKICQKLRKRILAMTDVPISFCHGVALEYPLLTFLIQKKARTKSKIKIPGINYFIELPKELEYQPIAASIDLENKCAYLNLNTEEPYFVANKISNRKKEFVWFGPYGLKNGPISGSNIVLVRQNNRSVPFYDPKECITKLLESVKKEERKQRLVIFKQMGKDKIVFCIPAKDIIDTLFKYSKFNRKTIEIITILNIIHADWYSIVRKLKKPKIKNSPYSFYETDIQDILLNKLSDKHI